jgi:hypothetical protein
MADPIESTTGARSPLICEFCRCSLSSSGEIIRRSPEARAFLDLDDDNAKLRDRVEVLRAEVATLTADLTAARAAAPVTRADELPPFIKLE